MSSAKKPLILCVDDEPAVLQIQRKMLSGGGSFGAYYFFTKDISILNGPVWFNDHALNGQWKWTTQVHINF